MIAETTVILPCQGEGTPPPVPLWTLPGRPQPLGIGTVLEEDDIEVLQDGSLRVNGAKEGSYTCILVNSAGGIKAQAWITVVPRHQLPPPLLTRTPPHTLTLHSGSRATLPCQARGPPQVSVKWLKDGKPLGALPHGVILSNNGNLVYTGKFISYGKSYCFVFQH